ncbi:hypothetical protein [Plantactinospora sp. DSM 117369]
MTPDPERVRRVLRRAYALKRTLPPGSLARLLVDALDRQYGPLAHPEQEQEEPAVTSMFDSWSTTLEDLTARRFLHMHKDGRRCRQCDDDGKCRYLTWAVGYFTRIGDPVPGQAADILARASHPGEVTPAELREVAQTLRRRIQ